MSDAELRSAVERLITELREERARPKNGLIESLKARMPTILVVIGACVSGTWYVSNFRNEMLSQLNSIQYGQKSSWRVTDQREWASQLKERNISLSVPDIDKVRREVGN